MRTLRGMWSPSGLPAASVTGGLPRPVAQIEHFLRIGQTHDQRRVAHVALIVADRGAWFDMVRGKADAAIADAMISALAGVI